MRTKDSYAYQIYSDARRQETVWKILFEARPKSPLSDIFSASEPLSLLFFYVFSSQLLAPGALSS